MMYFFKTKCWFYSMNIYIQMDLFLKVFMHLLWFELCLTNHWFQLYWELASVREMIHCLQRTKWWTQLKVHIKASSQVALLLYLLLLDFSIGLFGSACFSISSPFPSITSISYHYPFHLLWFFSTIVLRSADSSLGIKTWLVVANFAIALEEKGRNETMTFLCNHPCLFCAK